MTGSWRSCRVESPDGYLCTQRVYREDGVTHLGDHVAEGRAEGEPDSVIASWPQEVSR